VHLRTGEEYGEPFVARIVDLFEDSEGESLGTVQWLYRPNDLPQGTLPTSSSRSSGSGTVEEIIYAAEHLDKISVATVIETFKIEFLVVGADGTVQKHKSDLYADKESTDSSRPCLYRCSQVFDLRNSVYPITEALYKIIQKNMSITFEEASGKRSKGGVEKSSTRGSSVGDEDGNRELTSSEEEEDDEESSVGSSRMTRGARRFPRAKKRKQQPRRSTRGEREADDDLVELSASSKRAKAVKAKSSGRDERMLSSSEEEEEEGDEDDEIQVVDKSKKKRGRPLKKRVVDDADFIAEQEAALAAATSSPALASPMVATRSTPKPRVPIVDLDEKLWGIFQQLRNEIGSDDALEILGYLKLEMLVDNTSRVPGHQIAPPAYLQSKMSAGTIRPFVTKAKSILGIQMPASVSSNSSVPHSGGVRRAFEELEKCRPGVIFSQLGFGMQSGRWLFPETRQASPVFGVLLGLDGFMTCKMMYQKQVLHVPIEREGSVAQAALRGFSRLVTSNYAFTLIRTGDFVFEVAPSPDEASEQIFIKTPRNGGRTLCVSVPAKKALVRFLKVLVREHEGLSLSQQRFRIGDNQFGAEVDDDLPLIQCGVKASSTLQLIVSK